MYDLKLWLACTRRRSPGSRTGTCARWPGSTGSRRWCPSGTWARAAEIEALLDAREAAALPERTRHLAFGDVAAAWGVLDELGVTAIIDDAAGPRPAGQPLSTGTYLALAALNRLVAPCSKAAFADWWKTTAADRFTKIRPRRWITAASGTRCAPSPREQLSRSHRDRGADRGAVRVDVLVGGPRHDELRHLHRHRERQGAGRAARQGQAEARLTCGWSGWAWWSPGTAGSR